MSSPLRTLTFIAAAVFAYTVLAAPALPAARAADQPTPAPTSAAPVLTAHKAFYILVDPASDRQSASIITIATAAEFNKAVKPSDAAHSTPPVLWAIPEPAWNVSDFAKQCRDDPNAVGAVVLSYYSGDSTHFWLLWQTQTTTFELLAQIISCDQNAAGVPAAAPTTAPGAETVAIISELHGANGTPWVERRSDASIPLLSGVALVALIKHNATKSEPTNVLTIATLGTALLGQSFNKDVPGYSQPVRYRFDAHHVGVDVVTEIRWLCGQPDVNSTVAPAQPTGHLADLCKALDLPRP